MGRTGKKITGADLLYGQAPRRGKPEAVDEGLLFEAVDERTSRMDLQFKLEDFRQLMLRNTDRSDPFTDAVDFLADFMHWERESGKGCLGLDAKAIDLYRIYERLKASPGQLGVTLDRDSYEVEMDSSQLRRGLVELSDADWGDDSKSRARRIGSEMKLLSLLPEDTFALFRIWCEELRLDYNQVYDQAELTFRRDPA